MCRDSEDGEASTTHPPATETPPRQRPPQPKSQPRKTAVAQPGEQGAKPPGFRSLEELSHGFKQRCQAGAVSNSRSAPLRLPQRQDDDSEAEWSTPEDLSSEEEEAYARPKLRFGSLENLQRDFQRRRQRQENEAAARHVVTSRANAAHSAAEAGPVAQPVVRGATQTVQPEDNSSTLSIGTLKKLVERKGFGFVTPDEGQGSSSGDVFLHFSELLNGGARDMAVGMRVQFAWEADPRSGKRRARHATILRAGADSAAENEADSEEVRLEDELQSYRRDKLLFARSKLPLGPRLGIHSVQLPEECLAEQDASNATGLRARGKHGDTAFVENPSLDDEDVRPEMELHSYGRDQLLYFRSKLPLGPRLGTHTIQIPEEYIAEQDAANATGRRARGKHGDTAFVQNPSLDDEDLLVAMEAREARESGADAKNAETFGDECLTGAGWSFEEALAANTKLRSNKQDVAGWLSATTASSEKGEESTVHSNATSPISRSSADPREGVTSYGLPRPRTSSSSSS